MKKGVDRIHFFDAIAANKRNSNILIFGMFIVSLILLYFLFFILFTGFCDTLCYIDYSFVFFLSFIITSFYILFSYKYGISTVLSLSNAKLANRKEHPYLHHVVEGLSIGAGIKIPKIYVIQSSAPNAFAMGKDPDNSIIGVTSGLLDKLNKRELSGVIAHEVSHIANYDVRYVTMAIIMVGFISIIGNILLRVTGASRSGKQGALPLLILAIIFVIIGALFAEFARFAVSRQREYLADANGARMTRDPPALASALKKISGVKTHVNGATKETASMYFSDPLIGKFHGLFASHPPPKERIKRLNNM